MEPPTLDKIIKLMNLTSSDNDHEALSAVRLATRLLSQNGISWKELLSFKTFKFSDEKKRKRPTRLDKARAFVLNFGKYKDYALQDVPDNYLVWLMENMESDMLREFAELVFDNRESDGDD